jgi:catechol 2,3-dioxygenase-like lactoylglutathione lyase family enzyme
MALDYVQEITASMAVTDLDRSIDWYRRVLGFELLYRVDEIGWCELSTNMAGFNVGLSESREVAQGGGATNVWSVASIAAAKSHLDALGVRQDGGVRTIDGMVSLLTFFDPDGNALMFAESLRPN